MNLGHYVSHLCSALADLDEACRAVAAAHAEEPDVDIDCTRYAERCADQARLLDSFLDRYPSTAGEDEGTGSGASWRGPRDGPLGLLRDLHDLYLMSCDCDISWTIVAQGAQAARDLELLDVVRRCEPHVSTQTAWMRSRMQQAAPQVLVVAR